jgi:hypothetical protein
MLKKSTTYNFSGDLGYTYASKEYNSDRVSMEINISNHDGCTETVKLSFDPANARSMARSFIRACVDINQESGLDVLRRLMSDYQEELSVGESED